MEELTSQDLEELMQEMETESRAEDVEDLLRVLETSDEYLARRDAVEQLGKVETSNHRIVRALLAAYEFDSYSLVNRAAAKALRAPVHQEYLEQDVDLKEAVEKVLEQAPGADRQVPQPEDRGPTDSERHLTQVARSGRADWVSLLAAAAGGFLWFRRVSKRRPGNKNSVRRISHETRYPVGAPESLPGDDKAVGGEAGLYEAFVHRGVTDEEVAGMSLEELTRSVAYRRSRKSKVPEEMRLVAMSDGEIARAVRTHARMLVADPERATQRAELKAPAESGRVLGVVLTIALAWVAGVFAGSSTGSYWWGAGRAFWLAENLPRVLEGISSGMRYGFCCTLPALALGLLVPWILARGSAGRRLSRSSVKGAVIGGASVAIVGGFLTGWFGVLEWYY